MIVTYSAIYAIVGGSGSAWPIMVAVGRGEASLEA